MKRALRRRLEPIRKVARRLRAHQTLILNWFAARKEFSSGIVEGLNGRVKLTIRNAYGYCTLETAEIARYHALGRFPNQTQPRILLRRHTIKRSEPAAQRL